MLECENVSHWMPISLGMDGDMDNFPLHVVVVRLLKIPEDLA